MIVSFWQGGEGLYIYKQIYVFNAFKNQPFLYFFLFSFFFILPYSHIQTA